MHLLRRRCAERGLAFTHQRQVIYRALVSSHLHPSPEEIYEQVRAEMPSISLATVYKNIKTFLEIGLLRELTTLHENQRLDANLEPHHHLVCERCKKVEDLPAGDLQPLRWKRSQPRSFQIKAYKVEVSGLCAECARKQKIQPSTRGELSWQSPALNPGLSKERKPTIT